MILLCSKIEFRGERTFGNLESNRTNQCNEIGDNTDDWVTSMFNADLDAMASFWLCSLIFMEHLQLRLSKRFPSMITVEI